MHERSWMWLVVGAVAVAGACGEEDAPGRADPVLPTCEGNCLKLEVVGVPTGTVKGAGALLRRLQNGNVQWYATLVVLGMALLLALWAFGGGG